jgi:rhamnose transport system ATP-binding protein
MTSEPAAVARHVAKSYGRATVLADVNLTISDGTTHALVGENGAGKSTLVKILAGAIAPDAGTVEIGGVNLRPSPRTARHLGVRCIHQSRMLAPNLSVADNLALGRQGVRRTRERDRRFATACLERVGAADIDVNAPVRSLGTGQAQLVEIARELADEARLLIMDEPTAALSSIEAARLLETVRALARSGTAILIVSHDMEHVLSTADFVTVIRDGVVTLHEPAESLNHSTITRAMLGHAAAEHHRDRTPTASDLAPLLSLHRVSGGVLSSFDVDVRPGEIVGVTGILGSGIDEVARIAAGVAHPSNGSVTVATRPSPRSRRGFSSRSTVGYVPSDRARDAIFGHLSVTRQLDLTRASLYGPRFVARGGVERRRAEETASTVGLDSKYLSFPAQALSGGNQQKVVLGRVLQAEPKVLVVHDPTLGVDIGARSAIHDQLRRVAAEGAAVLLVSADMSEIAQLADRVIVLRRGDAVYDGPVQSQASLMEFAMGSQHQ